MDNNLNNQSVNNNFEGNQPVNINPTMPNETIKPQKSFALIVLKYIFVFIVVVFLSGIFEYLFGGSIQNGITNGVNSDFLCQEFVGIIFIFLIIIMSGNTYIFSEKGESFFKAIGKGWPILLISSVFLIINMFSLIFAKNPFNSANFVCSLLLYFTVGMYEEFLCRGWLQNELIERYSTNRKQVIKSIIVASIFFGLLHSLNIMTGQGIFMTILQIVQVTFFGFLLGVVYYRSKNIWSVVFLHAFYDFSLSLSEINTTINCSTKLPISGFFILILTTILLVLYYLFSSKLLISKTDMNNLVEQKDYINSDVVQSDGRKKSLYLILVILIFVFVFVFQLIYMSIINKNTYCPTVNNKKLDGYGVHYYYQKSYNISYTKINNALTGDTKIIMGSNIPTSYTALEKYDYKVYLDNDSNIVFENLNTKDIVRIKYSKPISGLAVYPDGDNYDVVFYYTNDDGSSIGGYTNYINNYTITNSSSFVNQVQVSISTYDLPSISTVGYISSDFNYPLYKSKTNQLIILDKEGKLDIVK